MNEKIPWWHPQLTLLEKDLLLEVLNINYLNEGEYTERFEKNLCEILGVPYALTTTSGTTALFLALKALGIGPGDEVIVPNATFIATANAVSMAGAQVVLVDVDPQTLTLHLHSFEKAITAKTKGVIPVHVSGRAAPMEKILEIAQNHHLFVIEDAAEALRSKHKGKSLGTFGHAGCLSFSPHKIITTGQGETVITQDPDLYQILRELKDQGRPQRGTGGDDTHLRIGYNFKFTNLQAAVGLAASRFRKRIGRAHEIHRHYREYLKEIPEISLLPFHLEGGEYPLWTDAFCERRDGLIRFLEERNMECRKFWHPLNTQKPYRATEDSFPNSTHWMKKAFWLPSAFVLTDHQIQRVCEEIKSFFRKK